MQIKLSDHFTVKKLLRFTLPSIVMMVFTSVYGVVDGTFVSNFAGEDAFAALNLIYPFLAVFSAIGFMIGAGGSALVAKTLGEGDRERANRLFSMLICCIVAAGLFFGTVGILLLKPIAILLGASETLLPYCMIYGKINLMALVFFMLQCTFQSFLVTAERPKLGLCIVLIAGFTNMIGDAILVGVLGLGITGAALATAISQFVGGVIPFLYFISKKNDSLLHITKPCFDLRALGKVTTNGFSEFLSNLSMSFVNIIFNWKLLELVGEPGVSAYGIMMYLGFFCVSVFFGYSMGSSPIVGYHFGAGNTEELKNVRKLSFGIVMSLAVLMVSLAEIFAKQLSAIFVGYDPVLLDMTVRGFRLHALHFLIAGFNIYASAFFTALNNGFVSAFISFFRTLIFPIGFVILLPSLLGLDGIWLTALSVEAVTLFISIFWYLKLRKRYQY